MATTAKKREKEIVLSRKNQMQKEFGTMLHEYKFFPQPPWQKFEFRLLDGPSSNTLVDALKRYPNQERVLAVFQGIRVEDLEGCHMRQALRIRRDKVFEFRVRLFGMHLIFDERMRNSFQLFTAEVVVGKNEGTFIVGVYNQSGRQGFFKEF